MQNEPLLKEEQEDLVFNQEVLPKNEEKEENITKQVVSNPQTIDISSLLPDEDSEEDKEVVLEKEITKEEKKSSDIEFVKSKEEDKNLEEKDKNIELAKSRPISLFLYASLGFIVVDIFLLSAFNFYVGLKNRDVNNNQTTTSVNE